MVLVTLIATGPMIETLALAGLPPPDVGTALLVTQDPATQLFTVDRIVSVAGGSQSPIVPTVQFTVFPAVFAVPLLGFPTNATLFMHPGTTSCTATAWGVRLETVKLRNAT